nr:hypothetical protein [Pseudodesulfovibrio sp.]
MLKKTPRKSLLILILALSFAALMMTGCKRQIVYNVSGDNIPQSSSKKLTMEQVENAIIDAGTGRGWMMSTVKPGLIVATLNIRNHQAVVDVTYDESTFDITYKNSRNLKYDGEKIHRYYNGWIEYLEQDIQAHLTAALSRSK